MREDCMVISDMVLDKGACWPSYPRLRNDMKFIQITSFHMILRLKNLRWLVTLFFVIFIVHIMTLFDCLWLVYCLVYVISIRLRFSPDLHNMSKPGTSTYCETPWSRCGLYLFWVLKRLARIDWNVKTKPFATETNILINYHKQSEELIFLYNGWL